MAIYWMSQVWENAQVDKSIQLLTFLAIADSANREGVAWPGVEKLAVMTRQTPRNMTRVIGSLAKTGELYVHRQPGRSNFYFIYINREREEAKSILQKWFKFSQEQSEHTLDTLDNLLNRTPDKLSPLTDLSGTPDTAMSPDPLLSLLYNKGGELEPKFVDIRSTESYRDLQNAMIGVCKKLNAVALKEKDVENIDILFHAQVEPAEVKQYYSKDGQTSWWYTQYWKGKKAQFPTTQDVIDTIEQARAFSGNNSSEAALQEVLEWNRGSRKFSDFSSPITVEVIRELGEYEIKNGNPKFWSIQFKVLFDTLDPDK